MFVTSSNTFRVDCHVCTWFYSKGKNVLTFQKWSDVQNKINQEVTKVVSLVKNGRKLQSVSRPLNSFTATGDNNRFLQTA